MSARDWTREPYRKLFLRPSPEFRALPVLTQGLAYVLTREAEDDGSFRGDNELDRALEKIMRTCGTHPRERRLVKERLQQLIDDGFIVHEDGTVVVRNLVEMNERRGSGTVEPASRPRPERASKRLDRAPSEHRNAASERHPSTDEPQTSTIAPQTSGETDSSSRNRSAETASRARDQVGSQVGRKVDQGGQAKRQLPPAPDDHPITELIAANEVLVLGASPPVLAAGVIALGSKRSEDELVEATEIALETVKLKLSTGGLSDAPEYFGKVVANLLRPGGLEAARVSREPFTPNTPVKSAQRSSTGSGVDLDHERERMRRSKRASGDDE